MSFTGLTNPTATTGTVYSVVLYNGPNCSTVISTTLAQAPCCALSLTVGTPVCNGTQYTVSGSISLTLSPAIATTLTITDNGVVQPPVSVSAGQTAVTFSLTGSEQCGQPHGYGAQHELGLQWPGHLHGPVGADRHPDFGLGLSGSTGQPDGYRGDELHLHGGHGQHNGSVQLQPPPARRLFR